MGWKDFFCKKEMEKYREFLEKLSINYDVPYEVRKEAKELLGKT